MKINGKQQWITIAVLFFIVLLGELCLFQPRLVVVDMARVVQRPSEMLSRSNLSEKAQQKIMQRYAAALPKVISEYGEAHGVTVLSCKVLVSQSHNDISNIIIEQTLSRLKHDAI
ncbi:MAG: hypothetical protein A3F46_01120 [Legionellales bacterium RIFCSPHIGHO2_12_FULL_42_9]|nr:MAG: hypothetical protein A3F46_01120 [Legionellales bacterium RIFCSPHIGHO2_12_FULL_42_9]